MKRCPYCGREYPDDVTVCIIDGHPLDVPAPRKKISGIWRGAYGYDNEQFAKKIVPFTLKLKQGWFGHFTGSVVEDPVGMPGTGTIDDYFGWPTIEFTKQMPVSYTTSPEGKLITLREWIVMQGAECKNDLPGPPISYEGDFLDNNRMQGTWIIWPRPILLSDGRRTSTGKATGPWCAEYITSDLNAAPTGGPQQPWFEKELLFFRPEADPDFKLLATFTVMDANKILKRFEIEQIRFGICRNAAATRRIRGRYARLIEIYVHQDDKDKASAIIGEDLQV